MNGINFEAIALMAISAVLTSSQGAIDKAVDDAADKVIAAVNDSSTQLDDVGAKAAAAALERFAARVKAGV